MILTSEPWTDAGLQKYDIIIKVNSKHVCLKHRKSVTGSKSGQSVSATAAKWIPIIYQSFVKKTNKKKQQKNNPKLVNPFKQQG